MKKVFTVFIILVVIIVLFFTITTNVTNNLDDYVYSLPFEKGERYQVVQGYGGLFSHTHIAAIDFSMPTGTPVLAARGGVVYAYKDNSDEGGPFPWYAKKANYIIIKHDDGSLGCYWHLKKDGVIIKHGQVKEGQLIGYSGKTGFVLRAHLHFSVKKKLNYEKDSFVRTKFRTQKGEVLLRVGYSYEKP